MPLVHNVMFNTPRFSKEKRVYKKKRAGSVLNLFTGLVEKNTAWMKRIGQRIAKPGKLGAHACLGMFSVVKICIFLRKHRRLVRYEASLSYVTDEIPQLVLIYG